MSHEVINIISIPPFLSTKNGISILGINLKTKLHLEWKLIPPNSFHHFPLSFYYFQKSKFNSFLYLFKSSNMWCCPCQINSSTASQIPINL